MKLSKKSARLQAKIVAQIKAGLPLAGLLTGIAAGAGCNECKFPELVGEVPELQGIPSMVDDGNGGDETPATENTANDAEKSAARDNSAPEEK